MKKNEKKWKKMKKKSPIEKQSLYELKVGKSDGLHPITKNVHT